MSNPPLSRWSPIRPPLLRRFHSQPYRCRSRSRSPSLSLHRRHSLSAVVSCSRQPPSLPLFSPASSPVLNAAAVVCLHHSASTRQDHLPDPAVTSPPPLRLSISADGERVKIIVVATSILLISAPLPRQVQNNSIQRMKC